MRLIYYYWVHLRQPHGAIIVIRMASATTQHDKKEPVSIPDASSSAVLTEAEFIDICQLTAAICHSPVSLISIIDRDQLWHRSHHPLVTAGLTADFAFNAQAMHSPKDIYIIPDLLKHYKFGKSILVTEAPYVAFYVGVPLVNTKGDVLGTLCLWDYKARELDAGQLKTLQSLSSQVALLLDQKKNGAHLAKKVTELEQKVSDLDNFAGIAAHDLKSPLNAIVSLTDLLRNNYSTALDEEGNEYINFLHEASQNLTELVTAILNYSRSPQLLTEQKEDIDFAVLVEEVKDLFIIPHQTIIAYEKNQKPIRTSRVALKQIIMALLDNAVKHNDKEIISVELSFTEGPTAYTIFVKDNGPGIPAGEREQIFELFKKQNKRKDGRTIGVGLPIVKKLAQRLGGSVKVESEPSKGSTFIVTLPK